jgi:hypothetical protein
LIVSLPSVVGQEPRRLRLTRADGVLARSDGDPSSGWSWNELESVTCCGAGEIHEAEPNLISSERAILAHGETLMTVGNVCTLNLRGQRTSSSGATRSCTSPSTSTSTRRRPPYNGGIELKRMLYSIAEGDGHEQHKLAAPQGLRGLRIACSTAPDPPAVEAPRLRGSRPWSLEAIIEACGARLSFTRQRSRTAASRCRSSTLAAGRRRRRARGLGAEIKHHVVPVTPALESYDAYLYNSCPMIRATATGDRRIAARMSGLGPARTRVGGLCATTE